MDHLGGFEFQGFMECRRAPRRDATAMLRGRVPLGIDRMESKRDTGNADAAGMPHSSGISTEIRRISGAKGDAEALSGPDRRHSGQARRSETISSVRI
jgi:hypothetical protein